MIDPKFRGRKMLCVCSECGHYQPGWEKIDGDVCEVCGGYLKRLGWWDKVPKPLLRELLDRLPNIDDELMAFVKSRVRK